MRSYVKLNGQPTTEAIKALEKMAIDMPEVCIMDPLIYAAMPGIMSIEDTGYYFADFGDVPEQRCSTIVSKSGKELGEYDFFFEWFTEPNKDQINMLIEKIDKTLSPLGIRYTITTK